MYCNGQTLRHRKTNELVRLASIKYPLNWVDWASKTDRGTLLIRENGTKFTDNINNYTHIEDEFGRPYAKQPKDGQFVDESAKRYLVSPEEMAEMRQKSLEAWEDRLLGYMVKGKYSADTPGKAVLCPFSDGSRCSVFQEFFLRRRNATPLYKRWNSIKGEFSDGPMIFRHIDGQLWMYRYARGDLVVIQKEDLTNV